jgi:hypothetical protein
MFARSLTIQKHDHVFFFLALLWDRCDSEISIYQLIIDHHWFCVILIDRYVPFQLLFVALDHPKFDIDRLKVLTHPHCLDPLIPVGTTSCLEKEWMARFLSAD